MIIENIHELKDLSLKTLTDMAKNAESESVRLQAVKILLLSILPLGEKSSQEKENDMDLFSFERALNLSLLSDREIVNLKKLLTKIQKTHQKPKKEKHQQGCLEFENLSANSV